MSNFYADAILHFYKELCEHIRYGELIVKLVTQLIVTIQEKQDLDALQVGETTRCSRLLDLILDRGRDLRSFVQILSSCNYHKCLAKKIEEEQQKIENGERLPHVKVVGAQFKAFYKRTDFQLTEKLPGEDYILDVSDESQLVPLYLTVETLDKAFLQKQRARVKNGGKLQYRYSIHEGITSSIESVFDDGLMEGTNRLFICTGIAGVGKSVTVHRLAWQWANDQNRHLKRFHLVIVIPLSKVDCGQPLMEVLSDNTDGPGYIQQDDQDKIRLVIEKHSSDVLFIIDGGDEVSLSPRADLRKLINGELYPEAKVLIMARPDFHSLAAIADLNPDVRIHLMGTNQESINRYIEASLVSEKASEDVIKEFKKLVVQLDILHIPLYLAMVSILFDYHWDDYPSFRVPRTATDILNSFMSVITKNWLQKLNRCDEMEMCTFERCPLEKGTKLPVDIRAKLVNMGRMSFECLLVQRYNFNSADLEKYLIDKTDIKACGMFRLTRGPAKEFCFIHQIFQQYLSALYIAHMQFQDARFAQHIDSPENTVRSREACFAPLELCIKFLFGMCPEFGREIFQKTLPSATCCQDQPCSLNLQFESELFRESGDSSLVTLLEECLCETEITVDKPESQCMGNNFECVYKMFAGFSERACIILLERLYNLIISKTDSGTLAISNKFLQSHTSPERQVTVNVVNMDTSEAEGALEEPGDGWCVLNKIQVQKDKTPSTKSTLHDDLYMGEQNESLIIENFDVICYCLLSKFSFSSVSKLVLMHSVTLDVAKLQDIFPNLNTLEVSGSDVIDAGLPEIHEMKGLLPGEKAPTSKIQHVKLCRDTWEIKVPSSVTSGALFNEHIMSMHLTNMQVFEPISQYPTTCPELHHLSHLTLSDCKVDQYMHELCSVLKHAGNLDKLHLHNTSGSLCGTESAEILISTIADHIPTIRWLALVHIFDSDGIKLLCSFIPKLQSLDKLSLGELDIMDAKEDVIKVSYNISLHVYIWYITKKDIRKILGKKCQVSPLTLPSPSKPVVHEDHFNNQFTLD